MSTPARKFQVEGLTQTFVRKPFEIQAVQVTEENMKDVAKWCGGKIKTKPAGGEGEGERYILVPVHNPANEDQRMAFPGKWVLWSRTTAFKVYAKRAFASSLDPKVTEPEENVYTEADANDQLIDYAKPEDSPLHPEHKPADESPEDESPEDESPEAKLLRPIFEKPEGDEPTPEEEEEAFS